MAYLIPYDNGIPLCVYIGSVKSVLVLVLCILTCAKLRDRIYFFYEYRSRVGVMTYFTMGHHKKEVRNVPLLYLFCE